MLDPTRPVVMQLNDLLPVFIGRKRYPRWLNFVHSLLDPDTNKLKAEYEMDATHLNPSYIPLLEGALEVESSVDPQ